MAVMMMLEGGPLDGEFQIVEMLPTAPGSPLTFNLPNFQTFDPNAPTETVIGLGLQAVYALTGQGPDPAAGDNWDSSWIFAFTGEAFIPTPAGLPEPGPQPPVYDNNVWMSAESILVPDTLPIVTSPVVTLAAESAMEVDGLGTPVQWGVVVMSGETVMQVTPDWSPQVSMNGQSSMEVDPS